MEYRKYRLGDLIEQYDEINENGEFSDLDNLQGINSNKYFQECKSNKNDIDLYRYRICRHGMFSYNRATSRNGEKISIALRTGGDCIVSPSYYCFRVKNEDILCPEYLDIWFKRPVFDRYARFNSWGSATEFFTFDDFCATEIMLPPVDEQHKIVHDYQTIVDRIALLRKINENLAEQISSIYSKWFEMYESPYSSSDRVPSELGDIPFGWKVSELGDYIESFSKSHSFDKEELIFLNTSDILAGEVLKTEYMRVSDMPGQAKKQIRKGDILYSEIRPANKRYALVTFPADDYVVSTKLMVLRTTQDRISNLRIYHYLTMEKILEELHREADGKSGTFPQITFDNNLKHRKIIIADEKTEKAFHSLLKSYYSLFIKTQNEISSLKQIQYTLLSELGR